MLSCWIGLTQGRVAIVDVDDFAAVNQYKWFAMKSGGIWYAARNLRRPGRGIVLMHRELTDAPPDVLVDHHDRDGLNNRRRNLRVATRSTNGANRKLQAGTSEYKGVHWSNTRGCWIAKLTAEGRNVYLGQHQSEESAARAYDAAAREHFGEYALLNFREVSA